MWVYEEFSHTGVESLILMDPVQNPYAPGAGQRSLELTSRDLEQRPKDGGSVVSGSRW